MNYLAHAYLSFNNSGLLLGNMISDYVKGKKQYDYPLSIQQGIQLHRAIDDFTDTHFATQQIKEFFKPAYRLYSGAFTDVVYDYYLANDVNEFADEAALKEFSEQTYSLLEQNSIYFPEKFAVIFPYMKMHNWLYNYRQNEGMQKSFAGLAKRAAYINESETAYTIFIQNKQEIKHWYNIFFGELKAFAAHKARLILQA